MNRIPITNILGLALRVIEPISGRSEAETEAARNNQLCLVRSDNPTVVVATIGYDDLFDAEGNRFYDNRCHPRVSPKRQAVSAADVFSNPKGWIK